VGILDAIISKRPAGEWLPILSRAGIPCAPIRDVAEALADPQVASRNGVVELHHPALGDVRQVASPFRITDFAGEVRRGPYLGAAIPPRR
jgi:crotonobetainyl-CoA:carnitine CoA-transferase CaiB-like acyl-CoA transferase